MIIMILATGTARFVDCLSMSMLTSALAKDKEVNHAQQRGQIRAF